MLFEDPEPHILKNWQTVRERRGATVAVQFEADRLVRILEPAVELQTQWRGPR